MASDMGIIKGQQTRASSKSIIKEHQMRASNKKLARASDRYTRKNIREGPYLRPKEKVPDKDIR